MATTIAPAVPNRLIDLSPTIKQQYEAYFKAVFDGGSLDEKSRSAAALGAAMALNNQAVIRSFLTAAKQVGLTNDDLGQVAAIVDLIRTEVHQRGFELQPKASKSCC